MGFLAIVGFIVFMAIIIFVVQYFSKKAIVKRKLKKTPKKPIRLVQTNEVVRITGKVESVGDLLIAPLSGRKCVYYYVLVQIQRSTGKSTSWTKLIEEEVPGKFLVRDGDNYAVVDTNDVKSYIVQDKNYSSGFRKDAEQQLEAYLQSHGHSSTGFLGMNKALRYKEGILEVGEMITVAGKAEWRNINAATISSDRILTIKPTDKSPVYLSDDPEVLN